MTHHQAFPPPYKSVAAALLLSAVLGPVGVLYASFWSGVIMILIGIIVVCSQYLFPIILFWLIACMLSVWKVERYNKKIAGM
jgi:hypothetical protein